MKNKAGFTLLELSIVLLVLSIFAATIFAAMTRDMRRAKQAELQRQMDTIESALMNFRRLNDRIPCPADVDTPISDQYFGVEEATGCTPYVSGKNFTVGTTVEGVIPVRTLGLPDEYMFDPWGGRYSYAVDSTATGWGALVTAGVTSPTIGSITVKDASSGGHTITSNAVAIVISHGLDGHGAYQLSGARKSSGSNNADEQKNCHCDNTATAGGFDATYIQHADTTNAGDRMDVFDDILRYYTRSTLISPGDTATGP